MIDELSGSAPQFEICDECKEPFNLDTKIIQKEFRVTPRQIFDIHRKCLCTTCAMLYDVNLIAKKALKP